MAITTNDGALAGMRPPVAFSKVVTPTLVAGAPQSLWGLGGNPGAGVFDNTLNGVVRSSSSAMVSGQLYHVDPGSGNTNLGAFDVCCNQGGTIMLLDRLWENQLTVNSTSLQSPTTPTWPARDNAQSTNGDGVLLAIETSAAVSSTAAVVSVAYTNQAGTAGRTAAFVDLPTAAVTAAGRFYRIGLQAGDTGVRAVTGVTFSTAWTTGTINMVAYRLLARIVPISAANIANGVDPLTGGFGRIANGAVPFLVFIPNTTSAANISGSYIETQG